MFSFTLIFTLFKLGLSFDLDIQAKYESLPPEEFIEYFNTQGVSWTAANHVYLDGMIFNCRMPDVVDERIPTVVHENVGDLPTNLDAREKWSNCPTIRDVQDQKHCASCWAFGMSTTASDRLCIKTGETVRFSQQDLACCSWCAPSGVCNGGSPILAFLFWNDQGLVSQECRPYDIQELYAEKGCKKECSNGADYNSDKRYGDFVYYIPPDENSIKAELFKNGSIEAGMAVFEDFHKFYGGGIYEHTFGNFTGFHSVRLIGYGEEGNIPYWLAANSWGEKWGDNGFFKIKRYQKEINIENRLYTANPKV